MAHANQTAIDLPERWLPRPGVIHEGTKAGQVRNVTFRTDRRLPRPTRIPCLRGLPARPASDADHREVLTMAVRVLSRIQLGSLGANDRGLSSRATTSPSH